MPMHFSWAQVWACLRPQLKKLARQPWVWLGGLGLLAMLAAELWLRAQGPAVSVTPLAGQAPQPELFGDMSLAVSVTLKLALVIALIYGSMFLLRRWQGGWFVPNHKRVALLETTRLAPRQALHLVRVGERVLLIGATDQTVTLLSEVDLPAPAEAAPQAERPVSPAFAATLDRVLNQPDPAALTRQGSSPVC